MSFVRDVLSSGNRFVLRLAAIAALGGFLFGYDTGIIGAAQLLIGHDMDVSKFEQQAFVGSLLIGAVIGAIISGFSADALSRRWTKVVSGSLYVLGAIGSAAAQDPTQLIIARLVLGLSVGTASFVSPMYISELAPPKLRGGLTSFNQLMVVSGITIAYIAGWALKDVSDGWRWMLGIAAVPGLALAIGMALQPYSPRWLVEKGREDEARDVLRRARDDDEDAVDEELDGIREAAREEGGVRTLARPSVRPMVVLGLLLAIAQQLIGVNTVIYYAPTILKFTGLGSGSAITQALAVGVTNLLATLVAIALLDRVGRRPLLLTGTAGCVVSLGALGAFFASGWLQDHAPWLALAALVAYIASFAIGLGPVFWLMISEIFPLKVRSPAMATSTAANWTANFVVSSFFLTLTSAITRQGTFWLYAGFGVAAFGLFAAKIPETKGRSLEEIEQQIGGAGD